MGFLSDFYLKKSVGFLCDFDVFSMIFLHV